MTILLLMLAAFYIKNISYANAMSKKPDDIEIITKIYGASLSADGTKLAIGFWSTVTKWPHVGIYDLNRGEFSIVPNPPNVALQYPVYSRYGGDVIALTALSPKEGFALALADSHGKLLMFAPETPPKHVKPLDIHPDGTILYACSLLSANRANFSIEFPFGGILKLPADLCLANMANIDLNASRPLDHRYQLKTATVLDEGFKTLFARFDFQDQNLVISAEGLQGDLIFGSLKTSNISGYADQNLAQIKTIDAGCNNKIGTASPYNPIINKGYIYFVYETGMRLNQIVGHVQPKQIGIYVSELVRRNLVTGECQQLTSLGGRVVDYSVTQNNDKLIILLADANYYNSVVGGVEYQGHKIYQIDLGEDYISQPKQILTREQFKTMADEKLKGLRPRPVPSTDMR